MARTFSSVAATAAEREATRPGDDIIARPDVVMDRAFTVAAPAAAVWPWIAQLGKKRAGWYLPRTVERFLPRRGRAVRDILPAWQQLAVGDIVPDYGGQNASFEVAAGEHTRIHLRLRLAPVRRKWLAKTAGGFIDFLTIAGMAAGLKERLERPRRLGAR